MVASGQKATDGEDENGKCSASWEVWGYMGIPISQNPTAKICILQSM